MPKVIITTSDYPSVLPDVSSAKYIVTWLEAVSVSSKIGSWHVWDKNTPLFSVHDESIIILYPKEYFLIFSLKSIVRVESLNYESTFFLENGDFFSTNRPLGMIENELRDHHFFLIHPNHLINITHLKTFVQCNAFVTLSNSDAIPVSVGNDERIVDFLSNQTII